MDTFNEWCNGHLPFQLLCPQNTQAVSDLSERSLHYLKGEKEVLNYLVSPTATVWTSTTPTATSSSPATTSWAA
jgi:hypothetical protein